MIDGVLKVQQSSQETKKGHKDRNPLTKLLINRCTITIIIVVIVTFKFRITQASTRAMIYQHQDAA